ncbi:MAG: hypothetical protein HQ557_12860 [Bacteroidetes bacterium]|nr:hypothetical protein [Bacteroidota bacterium]
MKNQFKPTEQRVELFKQFYRKENYRPLLGFFKGSEYPVHRYSSMKNLPEYRPLVPEDFPLDAFIEDSEKLFNEHEACGGDFIWSASAFWGIPWLEAALGCPVYVNHSNGSLYSEPPPSFTGPDSVQPFNAHNPWVRLLKTYINHLDKKSSGRWPIGTTRMRGISDLLAALYGGTEAIYKMLENPEEIQKVCLKLTDFWLKLAQFQLDIIPDFYHGIGSFYYYTWAPKGTVWCQEDSTALLSPTLYSDFIERCIQKITDKLEGSIMHEHSTGYVPVGSYLSMNFHALELHIDEGGPSAEKLYNTYCRILAEKPLIIWGNISENDLSWIFSKLPPQGLAVITTVNSAEKAGQLWNKYIDKQE